MENSNSRHHNQNSRTMQTSQKLLCHHETKNPHHGNSNPSRHSIWLLCRTLLPPTIHKLDKLLIRLQKSICGLPRSASNVTTQLPHNLFGLNAFSLTQAYLRCIGEQLRDALNDPGKLGNIYQGLTNYIFSLHGGSKNSKIPAAACLHSPTTRTIYLLKTSGRIHFRKYMDGSHITTHPLETKWLSQRIQHPYINIKTSLCYIHKLYLYNITDITQLTQSCGTKLMPILDLKRKIGPLTNIMYKIHKKLQILFCEPTCNTTCSATCSSHAPPLILLQEFNIPPQAPPTPITPIPEQPTSSIQSLQTWNLIKLTLPNAILAHRLIFKKTRFDITRTYHTYLCQWILPDHSCYNK